MLIKSPHASRSAYPAELCWLINKTKADENRKWLRSWREVSPSPTPLWSLDNLAAKLRVGHVRLKDESWRSRTGSFKALGAPVALARLLLRQRPAQIASVETLFAGGYGKLLKDVTVVAATAGNHGTALAAAARSIGCRCVILLHAGVSRERESLLAGFGVDVRRVPGAYDDSVRAAARLASEHGWFVLSDTSYEGYEDVPRDVMQGYAAIPAEAIEQHPRSGELDCPYSHVFLQGGVGGLAAGVIGYLWETYGARRPIFVIVEPQRADCLLQSALHGAPSPATGPTDSIMVGMACGEPSPLAWRFIKPAADFFMTITDDQAIAGMHLLSGARTKDVPIVSGESGAAGLAGLLKIAASPPWRKMIGIGAGSDILLVNTEGAVASPTYSSHVGQDAESVLEKQRAWILKNAD